MDQLFFWDRYINNNGPVNVSYLLKNVLRFSLSQNNLQNFKILCIELVGSERGSELVKYLDFENVSY